MKDVQKLKEILKARNLKQEDLARELGVTFATLNRWINEVSLPRAKNREAIDTAYKNIFSFARDIKTLKQDTLLLSKSYNISSLLKRDDFVKGLVLNMTYSSNNLEGSTMTVEEVGEVINRGASFSHRSLVEHIEVKNHEAAIYFVLDNFQNKITGDYIKKLNLILMNGIKSDAGNFRSHNVRIQGSFVPTANHLSIEKKIKEFLVFLSSKVNKKDIILYIAQSHSIFEMIHPFSDGNGRVGRLLIMRLCLQNGLLPVIILPAHRKKYIDALQQSQLENKYQDLESVICEGIENTSKLI